MTKTAFRALFLCAVAGAIAFRTVRLDLRPMHADEANQAVKFGGLLERGEYRFDPQGRHGPPLPHTATGCTLRKKPPRKSPES